MANEIKHLIVLMLENRSFDHLFGFLDHPDSELRKLKGNEINMWAPGAPPAQVSSTASYCMAVDPGHKHGNVLRQLTGLPELHSPLVIK